MWNHLCHIITQTVLSYDVHSVILTVVGTVYILNKKIKFYEWMYAVA